MKIDLNCPAEAVGAELIRQEEDSWVRLILMNLSDRGIDSCEATVRLLSREGEVLGRTVHRSRTLRGRPHSAFSMMVPMELPRQAVRAEAVLDKVWYEDHEVWRRNPAREKEYEPNALPPGNELNALQYVAGETAVGFPQQQKDLWLCVCGRPNANAEGICARCRRSREMIFAQYSRGAVLRQVTQRERQLDLESRGAREETARLQRLREAEYDQRNLRRNRRKGLVRALICALLLAALCLGGISPALRLLSADSALRQGRLEEARDTLRALGAFPGAESRLADAETRIARQEAGRAAEGDETVSPDRIAETVKMLRETGDGDDAALADRAEREMARRLLAAGDFEGAESVLRTLPQSLTGRDGLLDDCAFARGQAALRDRDFEAARRIFQELGDYPGASDLAKKALYEPALSWMEAGEYDEAIGALSQIPDYQDSRQLIRQCWYLKGYTLENGGKAEEARQAYLAAEDYEDAAERAQAIRWKQGEEAQEAGDYAAALSVWRELDGTGDARERWLLCATELARAAYKEREYALAASWLEELPEDNREIRQIRTRALFLGAKAAAERGELEEAIAMMEKVAGYGDSERNLRTWRMDLARQWMEEERYEDAREILQPAAENYNVRKLLEEIEEKLTPPETEKSADGRAEEGAEETEEKAAPADPQPAEPEGTEEP